MAGQLSGTCTFAVGTEWYFQKNRKRTMAEIPERKVKQHNLKYEDSASF